MNTADFKKKLETEKEVLEKRMTSVGRPNSAVPGDWEPIPAERGNESDLVDQAEVIMSNDENAAILADLEARYDQVVGALERIEKGTYGVCEVGGEQIEEARLNADPAAATCKAHL